MLGLNNYFGTAMLRIGIFLGASLLMACSPSPEPSEKAKPQNSVGQSGFIEKAMDLGIEHSFMPKRVILPPDATVQHPLVKGQASINTHLNMSGGLAVGDINADGLPDVFLPGGAEGKNKLYLNTGKGFEDISALSGIDTGNASTNGATFADITGDGLDDLIIGGVAWYFEIGTKADQQIPATLSVWKNLGDNRFANMTKESGLSFKRNMFSTAFGDYDQDGDLDLVSAHWRRPFSADTEEQHIWQNQGKGEFISVPKQTGLEGVWPVLDWSFTPAFGDLNNDGWQDLVIAGDFEQSQHFINEQGRFKNVTDPQVITDENGMGSALGDYDNDGDLDWFVSSIFDPNPEPKGGAIGSWGFSGNRLYRNDGQGNFEDVTEHSGVRDGGWGWASCMADFNNDGHLDIFQVNGYLYDDHPIWLSYAGKFAKMRPRLFINNGQGQFVDQAEEWGVFPGEGRAISCTDFDRDGDVDVLVQQSAKPTRYYENQAQQKSKAHFLGVRLQGSKANNHAAGARITLKAGGNVQIREIQLGGNYLSQNSAEALFGLGSADKIEQLSIRWPEPNGYTQVIEKPPVDQWLQIKRQ